MAEDLANIDSVSLEEQLSAYLDGELDDESARRVEQLLASDPKVRKLFQQMERTWEVLDSLERPEVDETFTRSTLEMVALAAEEEAEEAEREAPRRRRRWLISGAAWLACAAALGFMAVALCWPSPQRRMLEDLPVLERLEQYRQIQEIEFLEALHEQGLLAREEQDEQ